MKMSPTDSMDTVLHFSVDNSKVIKVGFFPNALLLDVVPYLRSRLHSLAPVLPPFKEEEVRESSG